MRKTLYKNFRQRIWPISKNFLQILLRESKLFQKLMVYLPLSEIIDVSSRKNRVIGITNGFLMFLSHFITFIRYFAVFPQYLTVKNTL